MSTPTPPETATSTAALPYALAITLTLLLLISTLLLASYVCIRVNSSPPDPPPSPPRDPTIMGLGLGLPGPMLVKLWLDRPTYPELVLGQSKRLPRPNSGPCSICLSEYKPNEIIKCMPECNHCFHVGCIDQWLRMRDTCPLCRSSPVASAGATPLSDLAPLAFHPR